MMESLTAKQAIVVALICLAMCAGFVLALVGTILSHRARMRSAELEAEARNAMLAKGFSLEDIATLLNASRFGSAASRPLDAYEQGGIAPCDVVVDDPENDDRCRALLLAASPAGDAFLVHYVGREVSDNAWVTGSLVRFPASVAFDPTVNDPDSPFPFAIPVSVITEDEVALGYVVTRREKAFVCFAEQEWSENQWVDESQLRYDVPQAAAMARPTKVTLDF